jgi:hypothetical protein
MDDKAKKNYIARIAKMNSGNLSQEIGRMILRSVMFDNMPHHDSHSHRSLLITECANRGNHGLYHSAMKRTREQARFIKNNIPWPQGST